MRTFSLLTLLFVGANLTTLAQQPFEQFGVKVKVLSLSNGRYPEFFANDSLRRVGSVVYNRRLHRIAYLLPPDSLVTHPKPEVASRWLSTDPLEHEFSAITPYAYVDNNPIKYIDPDGRFKLDPAVAKAHPKLVTYFKEISKVYANKPAEFKKAFKEFSGLTNSEIKTMLAYGEGPTLTVKPLPNDNGQTMLATDKKGNSLNAQRNGMGKAVNDVLVQGPGYIVINEEIVKQLEVAATGPAKLMLESTVFHEAVHYGTGVRNTNENKYNKNGLEKGKEFEKKAYGADVNDWNAPAIASPPIAPIAPLQVKLKQ